MTWEYLATLARTKRSEQHVSKAAAPIANLQRQVEETQWQVKNLLDESKRQRVAADTLRHKVDTLISSFLMQGGLLKNEKHGWLRVLLEDVKQLEEELSEIMLEERWQRNTLAKLNSNRESNAREAAIAATRMRATHEQLKTQEIVMFDLAKKLYEVRARQCESQRLYNLMKADCNKYMHQVQASTQVLADMAEKKEFLRNAVEILRDESASKDKVLSKELRMYANAFNGREQLRTEITELEMTCKKRESQLEQQRCEVEGLEALVNRVESDILQLGKRHKVAIEERSHAGIQLIDRNRELCILYEKSQMQQDSLRKEELAVRNKEEETRSVNLQAAELHRNIKAMRSQLPEISKLEQQIVTLRSQLLEERSLITQLGSMLEASDISHRWRTLKGVDPAPEELASRLQVLEARLSGKRTLLLEKKLLLQGVTSLSNWLRSQVIERHTGKIRRARDVNHAQARVTVMTRRIMAAVSELSIYQATSMKLSCENRAREELLKLQAVRLDDKLVPPEEIERERQKYEQDFTSCAGEPFSANALHLEEAEASPIMQTTSVAELRPNAYIPNDIIRIPKPFGQLAPFKPSKPRTNIRHKPHGCQRC